MIAGEHIPKEFCSPAPPSKKHSHKGSKNKVVNLRIDGRRERKVRFCCRKRSGTAKTLPVKRVVLSLEQTATTKQTVNLSS